MLPMYVWIEDDEPRKKGPGILARLKAWWAENLTAPQYGRTTAWA